MPKILVTNDDGYDAPGIEALVDVLNDFGDVSVVAPALPQSGVSHQMTFESPLALTQYGKQSWHLSGTPADCVRVGLTQLEIEFDWVFSGINNGGNLGVDFFVSGTVAGAREATFFGLKAVALSQHRLNFPAVFDWEGSRILARQVIQRLMEDESVKESQLINVNLPDCSNRAIDSVSVIECQRDNNPLPYDYAPVDEGADESTANQRRLVYCGQYNQRKRSTGNDVDVCIGGDVSITRC